MFIAKFYPSGKKLYTDNFRVSMTNSMFEYLLCLAIMSQLQINSKYTLYCPNKSGTCLWSQRNLQRTYVDYFPAPPSVASFTKTVSSQLGPSLPPASKVEGPPLIQLVRCAKPQQFYMGFQSKKPANKKGKQLPDLPILYSGTKEKTNYVSPNFDTILPVLDMMI